jgi:hypothetical protein
MDYLELDEAQRNEWTKKEKEKKDRTKVKYKSSNLNKK